MSRAARTYHIVGVLVKGPNGFLMQHRDEKPGKIFDPGMVSFFGGAVEPDDDSLQSAAARELREETDLEFSEDELQHIVSLAMDYTTVSGVQEKSLIDVYTLETEATSCEVYEGQGLYVLPSDASFTDAKHQLAPWVAELIRTYMEKTKER